MRALSVFPGGFTADAARHLLSADILPVLEQLADQSLLKVVDSASGTRYRMLETVREFAAARREDAGETERVTGRFLAWARDFGVAHHDSVLTGDDLPAFELVRAEQDNLVQALGYGLGRQTGRRSRRCRPWGRPVDGRVDFRPAGPPWPETRPDPAAVPAGTCPRRDHQDQPGTRRDDRVSTCAGRARRGSWWACVGFRGFAHTFARAAQAVLTALAGSPEADFATLYALGGATAAGCGAGQPLHGQLRLGGAGGLPAARSRRCRGSLAAIAIAAAAPGSGPPRAHADRRAVLLFVEVGGERVRATKHSCT